jgi:hypothetical protein
MKFLRLFSKFFLLVTLPVIMMLFYNQSVNWHYHLLKDGSVIKHAHPYSNEAQGATPFQKHQHTDTELIFFAQFSQISLIIIAALLAFGLIYFLDRSKIRLTKAEFLRPRFLAALSLRAPPSVIS